MATEFLAAAVLVDKQIITYKLLSRELGCTATESKRSLEEFYNSSKGAVHAVYLVGGTKSPIAIPPPPSSASEGDRMSVDESSGTDQIPVSVLKVVSEGRLHKLKSSLASVDFVQVYSLGPGPLQDLEVVSDSNRRACEKDLKVTNCTELQKYGVIPNPWVWRRQLGAPPVAEKSASKPASKPAVDTPSSGFFGSQQHSTSQPKQTTKPAPSSGQTKTDSKQKTDIRSSFKQSGDASDTRRKAAPKKAPAKGSILASFSQAQAEIDAKKSKEKMAIPSDEEDEGETEADLASFVVKRKTPTTAPEPTKRSPKQMSPDLMDMDDEEEASESNRDDPDQEDVDMDSGLEPAAEEEPEREAAPSEEVEEGNIHVVKSDGRRRGKRRVTKKVRVKDEQGYLVTREDQVWESFSESDHEPVRKTQSKPPPNPSQSSSKPGGKKPESSGKKAQGSILSFFQKK